jgi:hypothetical protein
MPPKTGRGRPKARAAKPPQKTAEIIVPANKGGEESAGPSSATAALAKASPLTKRRRKSSGVKGEEKRPSRAPRTTDIQRELVIILLYLSSLFFNSSED